MDLSAVHHNHAERFQSLEEAYRILSDEASRRPYDEEEHGIFRERGLLSIKIDPETLSLGTFNYFDMLSNQF